MLKISHCPRCGRRHVIPKWCGPGVHVYSCFCPVTLGLRGNATLGEHQWEIEFLHQPYIWGTIKGSLPSYPPMLMHGDIKSLINKWEVPTRCQYAIYHGGVSYASSRKKH